jgi:OOP family OmpA-OmpF porin
MSRVKPGVKFVAVVFAVAVLTLLLIEGEHTGIIPTPGILKSVIPQRVVLPDVKDAQVQNVAPAPLPSDGCAKIQATQIRGEVWEWNAQAGLIFANGGACTTAGSLMAKHGVNLVLTRQDKTDQMQNDLIACADELYGGATQCTSGANFVVIMGGGVGQFVAGPDSLLAKHGQEYSLKMIAGIGFSYGEDGLLAPPEIKSNPQAARGLLFAGVIRDDDWNIAQKWAGDNSVPTNPDENTYDPDAVNWLNAEDYIKATELYNANTCVERKVVKDGHPTGQTKNVCVSGIVTWTPGDVNEAHGKGGLVKIVSTKQYIMPAVIVGPNVFFQRNRDEIENMLAATFEAGDQMKAFDLSLHKAMAISAKLYKDQDESYWYKYFKGARERDTQGQMIDLGGSKVSNLADALNLVGLVPGTNDALRSVYTIFRNIDLQQYPDLFKSTPIPEAAAVEDKSFITGAQAKMEDPGSTVQPVNYFAAADAPVVSKRSYSINFDTGRATFTPAGEQTMQDLRDSLAATALFIKVDGYTDDTGSDQVNSALSQARAQAVKSWLQAKARNTFPDSRFAVAGHGARDPVASNATAEGKAANRRVEITLSGGN